MRIGGLAAMITLTTTIFLGCGGNTGGGSPDSGSADTYVPSEPLSIEGSWLYLGPTPGGHTLAITSKSLKYAGTEDGWKSDWTIKGYDNNSRHFQIVFASGEGTYYPSGESFSGTFDATEMILSVQLAKGLDSYPQLSNPGSCTEDSGPIPDCKLYMKQ